MPSQGKSQDGLAVWTKGTTRSPSDLITKTTQPPGENKGQCSRLVQEWSGIYRPALPRNFLEYWKVLPGLLRVTHYIVKDDHKSSYLTLLPPLLIVYRHAQCIHSAGMEPRDPCVPHEYPPNLAAFPVRV